MQASEFVGNPVRSLFSSFASSTAGHSQGKVVYDSFVSEEYRNPSFTDLRMIIEQDDDDIKQARMMTQPTVADLK